VYSDRPSDEADLKIRRLNWLGRLEHALLTGLTYLVLVVMAIISVGSGLALVLGVGRATGLASIFWVGLIGGGVVTALYARMVRRRR
jgi:hypothetical protein